MVLCASGLVTVTLRAPAAAVAEIDRFAVSCVALAKAQEFTVMPAPKLHVAPFWKLIPLMITPVRLCPCAPVFGVTEVTVGGGTTAAVTENPLVSVALCASGLVTVTLRTPTGAVAEIERPALSCVAELKTQVFTVTPAPKLHVAPFWKLLPVMITPVRLCPCAPVFGVTEVTVGGGTTAAVTENPLVSVALCASGLVTVTLRTPTVAVAEIQRPALSCVAELKMQVFTVTPAPKLHVAPFWKLLPVMITPVRLCPCAPVFGVTEVTVGGGTTAAVTENPLLGPKFIPPGSVTVTFRVPAAAEAAI